MNFVIRIPLTTTAEQEGRLQALQVAFAQVCNAISPTVQQTRCWNRVALHHLVYKSLRARFPALGSQMVCNAIYSVSRTSRMIFQHPSSPFSLARLGAKPLPLLRFHENCPVYFDRHTLSVKAGRLSMYTLGGRMRFELALKPEDEAKFHDLKLQEIVLLRRREGGFELMFSFTDGVQLAVDASLTQDGDPGLAPSEQPTLGQSQAAAGIAMAIPEYVMVEEAVL
jgi:hypothetical protein